MPKIFLIDDDYASEILLERLGFCGYDARRINSATAALQYIDEVSAADLVILDMIMERPTTSEESKISGDRTTGMTLLRALRQKNHNLPILVYSASSDKELIDIVNRTPRTRFLSKWNAPSMREVLQTIETFIEDPTTRRRPLSFIIHGRDTVEKLALKNYLQNNLHFPEPIILHEQPNLGRTIIEKFEDYGGAVDLAFVLLTPDDKMATTDGTNDEKRRARQNVIFELGYFLGVFGRSSGRILLLHKGQLDLPSDLSGVIYIDISSGVEEAGEKIRLELANVI